MKIRFITILILIYFIGRATQIEAQVSLSEPHSMKTVVSDYKMLFPEYEEIEGWSILVALNQDRRKIDAIKQEFRYKYPSYRDEVQWIFENPYYKIIIGAFSSEKSARPWLDKIRQDYPGAFIVKNTFERGDIIEFRRIMPL